MSRKDLFDSAIGDGLPNTESNEKETYEPPNELEIVEVNVKRDQNVEKEGEGDGVDEFDFPLFSSGAKAGNFAEMVNRDDNREYSGAPLVRVSLREPSPESFIQRRPLSYYFMDYSEEDHERFKESAIDYHEILQDAELGPNIGWAQFRGPVLAVKEHNGQIARSVIREANCKKRRPGKKQRLARKIGSQNEKEREEKAKQIKKMIKKKFHKRGGKKNKKQAEFNPLKDAAKPKFRTE